jgi:hypothetical protein
MMATENSCCSWLRKWPAGSPSSGLPAFRKFDAHCATDALREPAGTQLPAAFFFDHTPEVLQTTLGVCSRKFVRLKYTDYSHSIVLGGFELMS